MANYKSDVLSFPTQGILHRRKQLKFRLSSEYDRCVKISQSSSCICFGVILKLYIVIVYERHCSAIIILSVSALNFVSVYFDIMEIVICNKLFYNTIIQKE